MAKRKKSVLRTGRKGIEEAGKGDFVVLKDGDKQSMASQIDLTEMVSFDQHAIWIEGGRSPMFPCINNVDVCPGCELGDEPRFRAVLPVVTLPEKETRLFSFGISIARGVESLEEEWEELAGRVFSVKRTGSGLKTKYTVVGSGKELDIEPYEEDIIDVVKAIGPQDREGIVKLLVETELLDPDALDEFEEVKAKPKKKKAKAKAKPKAKEEDDEDEWEDI